MQVNHTFSKLGNNRNNPTKVLVQRPAVVEIIRIGLTNTDKPSRFLLERPVAIQNNVL